MERECEVGGERPNLVSEQAHATIGEGRDAEVEELRRHFRTLIPSRLGSATQRSANWA